MNKTTLMTTLALAVSVAFVSVGMAQMVQQTPAAGQKSAETQKPAETVQKLASVQKGDWEKVRGVVEKVDEATKEVTIRTQKDKIVTFMVGNHSYITELTTGEPLSTLRKGMRVTEEYAKQRDTLIAKWIDVYTEG